MLDYSFLQHTYKLNVFLILYRFVNKPFFPELSVSLNKALHHLLQEVFSYFSVPLLKFLPIIAEKVCKNPLKSVSDFLRIYRIFRKVLF